MVEYANEQEGAKTSSTNAPSEGTSGQPVDYAGDSDCGAKGKSSTGSPSGHRNGGGVDYPEKVY